MARWILPPPASSVCLADSVSVTLTARSIAIDNFSQSPTTPSASSTMDNGTSQLPDDGFETRDVLVGEMRSADADDNAPLAFDKDKVMWYRGRLVNFDDNRRPCTRDEAVSLLQDSEKDLAVFLRIGDSTFRLCTFQAARLNSTSGLTTSETGSPLASSANSVSNAAQRSRSPMASGGAPSVSASSPPRRANDRYTSAVAFEFVTNVISNVIGEDLYPAEVAADE